jgi:shikimate kinase
MGCTIPTIFRDHGDPEFRRIEREVIARIVIPEPQVVSIGGGAFIDGRTREILNRRALTIWIDAPFDLVMDRLSESTARPVASGKTPEELRQLWEERRVFYEQAQIHIESGDVANPQAIVDQILKAIP